MDIASDGLVDWDEFCTYLMLQFEENDQATKVNGNTFIPKPNIVRIDHNKVCSNTGRQQQKIVTVYVATCNKYLLF